MQNRLYMFVSKNLCSQFFLGVTRYKAFQEGRKQGGRNEVCISSLALSVFVLDRPNDFAHILPVGGVMNGCVSFIILRITNDIKHSLDRIKFTKTNLFNANTK